MELTKTFQRVACAFGLGGVGWGIVMTGADSAGDIMGIALAAVGGACLGINLCAGLHRPKNPSAGPS